MARPLEDLRRAIIAGDHLEMDSKSIIVNRSMRLDRKTSTNFHSMRGRGDAYPLETVFFQYINRDKLYNSYVQQCRREGIGYVVAIDKKDMLAYLKGDVDTCAGLVSKKSAFTSRSKPTAPSASASDLTKHQSMRHLSTIAAERDTTTFASHRKKDRDQRSLDSILMVKDWNFEALRDKIAQHVSKAKRGNTENGPKNASNAFDPRGDRYTSNEGRFWRENLGSDFQDLGIDMSGSFKEKPSQPVQSGSLVDKKRSRPSTGPVSRKGAPNKRPRIDPKDLIPIIIVPTGFSTLICHANAVDFFENGRFESPAELQERKAAAFSKVSRVSAKRVPGGNCSHAEYHIVFNPNRLTTAEWERVVAVVCSGQEWQFKKWPIYKGDMQDLFRRVQGFYFHFDDTVPVKNAELWPIKRLGFSRGRRYMDAQVQSQFWNQLDSFLARRGKRLRY